MYRKLRSLPRVDGIGRLSDLFVRRAARGLLLRAVRGVPVRMAAEEGVVESEYCRAFDPPGGRIQTEMNTAYVEPYRLYIGGFLWRNGLFLNQSISYIQ